MMTGIFLVFALLLMAAAPISAAAPESAEAPRKIIRQPDYSVKRLRSSLWTVDSSKAECRMTLKSYENGELYLQSRDRDELQLIVDVPFLQNSLAETQLSWASAPWQQDLPPEVLAHGIARREGRMVFSHNVQRLADRLRKGHWGQIAVNTRDEEQLIIEISSIDFREPFKTFNACRNQLPPVRLARVRNTSVFFTPGSADSVAGDDLLNLIIRYLAYAPKTVSRITIDGYADSYSDNGGNRLKNLDLSRYRTRSVVDYLVAGGVDQQLIQVVRHHGQRYPVADNDSESGRSRNRRVDIQLLTSNEQDKADRTGLVKK